MPSLISLNTLAFSLLLVSSVFAQEVEDDLQKRDFDSFKIFERKRNAHACIMSIVFCVLYPLGAISIHLPIASIPGLRNTYLVKKVPAIHAPIQIIAFVMMVGGLALGIRIAHDIGYFDTASSVKGHMVIGLLVVCTIILFQPILGFLQHRFYKRNGRPSMFGYVHRWIGRTAIILGIINDGLGLRLAEDNVKVPTSSWVRNFALAGCLLLIWAGVVIWDMIKARKGSKVVRSENGGTGFESKPVTA